MKDFMQKVNWSIKSHWFILGAAAYFTVVLNLSFWRYVFIHLELSNVDVYIAILSLPVILCLLLAAVLNFLIWPYIGKPILIVLLLSASVANYFMYKLGIFIDADMIRNVFETTPRETLDLVTFSGLLWALSLGVAPALVVGWVKIEYAARPLRELSLRLAVMTLCLTVSGGLVVASFKEYSSFGRNNRQVRRLINPANYLYAFVRYFQLEARANRVFAELDPEADLAPIPDPHHTVFIIIVGETARAKNFSLNGYERETTPRLAQEDIINFPKMYSCGTATATSLPCMFSALGRADFDSVNAKYAGNLIDLLWQSGYQVWWRDNDDGCKGVCDRVPNEAMTISGNPQYCFGDYCHDEVLLDGLEEYLRAVTKDTVVVLHTMGSHGPSYYKRYPERFKKFIPECTTADLEKCSREEIVNTYDNTILYTDYIVSEAIAILKKFPDFEAGLLYVSDHGESLGENGIYLHGLPYAVAPKEQRHVPMLLWISENMKKYDYLDYGRLKENAARREYSHDYLFHSLLALLEVDSRTYLPNLDIFAPCRLPGMPEVRARGRVNK